MTPFEADLSWLPKAPVDMLKVRDWTVESVNEFRQILGEITRDAKFAHECSKAIQSAYVPRRTQPHSYKVGDLIWLNTVLFKYVIAKVQP